MVRAVHSTHLCVQHHSPCVPEEAVLVRPNPMIQNSTVGENLSVVEDGIGQKVWEEAAKRHTEACIEREERDAQGAHTIQNRQRR